MFVYIGHTAGSGLQVGKDEFYSLNALSEKFNEWKMKKPHFDKVIAFLDCCYPEKMNLKGLKLIQINATASMETKVDKIHGNPLLNYVMQAFTATAYGKGCILEDCECSNILQGSFITLNDLWLYLNEHTKHEASTFDIPFMHTEHISLQDTILAYNCHFKVQFDFTIEYPGKNEIKNMHVLLSDFNDSFDQLKSIGAEEVISNFYWFIFTLFAIFWLRVYLNKSCTN
ncbi:hypothetical protein DPMN_189817 [Dreissena polymorpha]|uniref:Uncharacterized protein n=1 Tax=Dreissena polymorpha TaxID=45954 RepID=A0A9D4DUR7_DREPO|nr:hypothetical protein DPMN_189817 [Dreissena polymorpha]